MIFNIPDREDKVGNLKFRQVNKLIQIIVIIYIEIGIFKINS